MWGVIDIEIFMQICTINIKNNLGENNSPQD